MKHEPIERNQESLASDFGLILEAIADAVRSISSPSRLESRWSRLRNCGCSF